MENMVEAHPLRDTMSTGYQHTVHESLRRGGQISGREV